MVPSLLQKMELPSTFSGNGGIALSVLQLAVVATSYSTETNSETRAKYSKFSAINGATSTTATTKQQVTPTTAQTWPSRFAMMVIYTPALLVSTLILILPFVITDPSPNLPSPSLPTALCVIHFAKRCLEVLFLHSYSGRTDRSTPSIIGVYYALVTVLIAYASGGNGDGISALLSEPNNQRITIGTTLFCVGLIGNWYHHYLLAKLRNTKQKTDNESKYVAPNGGLFEYVATPHYLFELIGWLGVAIVSNHLNVYLVFASMASYLGGRSVAQNEFNRGRFGEREWPRDRRNLIPFVF
jgi:protein-S-isoprenylcysteine O-methyltransferase Ste14